MLTLYSIALARARRAGESSHSIYRMPQIRYDILNQLGPAWPRPLGGTAVFQSKWEFGLAARDALALRRQVYVEELGMPEAQAFDRYDEIGAHVFVWDEQGPIAAGRIFPQGTATGIGAIAVAQGRRGEPFGELVLRILLDKAQTLAGDPILARLRPEEIPLYVPFGFVPVAGGAGGLYQAPRDGIRWHSACQDG